jgi:type III pantothenate kinase
MLLAIDSGNTNIVFAVFDDNGDVKGEWRGSTNTERTADEFGIWLKQLMGLDGVDPASVTSAIIATVVPANLFSLKTLCRKYFSCDPLIVGEPGVELGIKVLLDRPEEVGADRLANAVAAKEQYGGPLIVIDFGTATTFDLIDKDGNYCGGAIAPGINSSVEALHQAAAKLPRVAVTKPPRVVGRNTVAAMQSGVFWGYVAMIEGMVARISKEYGVTLRVIATGGLAPLFAETTACIEKTDQNLTMRGLYLLNRRNRPK